jgi:peptidoglycan/xylan/chitin deacetylase (PgdA/CDA1 family)
VTEGAPTGQVRRRRFLAGLSLFTVGGVAGTAVGYAAEQANAAESPTARTEILNSPRAYEAAVTWRTEPSARVIALTIDDGPTREWTPQVLAILRNHGASATFFIVGARAEGDPGALARAADEGHELANHTWLHSDLTQHDQSFDAESLERTHALIAGQTGRAPTLCRPPYGRIDSVGLSVCAEMYYRVMLWSNHVTGSDAAVDVNNVLREASPGGIVLAHDGGPEPNASLMKQLDRLVGTMKDRGYTFVTVSDLLAASGTTANTTG